MIDKEGEQEEIESLSTPKIDKPRNHVVCAVPHCGTYGATGFSIHSFPSGLKEFAQWKIAIGLRESRTSAKRWKVCGKHFKFCDYILPNVPGVRKKLQKGAVPSLNLPVGEMKTSLMQSTASPLNQKDQSSQNGCETNETYELSPGMLKKEPEMEEGSLPNEDLENCSPSVSNSQLMLPDHSAHRDSDNDSLCKARRSSVNQTSKPSKHENSENRLNRSVRSSSADIKSEKKAPGTCCIPSCTNNLIETRNDGLNISYYRFPRDKALCESWKATCGSYGPELNTRVGRICSVHFKDEDFEGGSVSGGKRGLKPKAIPSLYLLHAPEKKPEEPRKRKYTRKTDVKLSDEEIEMPRPIPFYIKSEPESGEEDNGGNAGDASGHCSDYIPEGYGSDEEFECNKKGKRRKVEIKSPGAATVASSPASNSSKKRTVKKKNRACPASKKNFSLTKPVVEMDKLENGVVAAAAEGLVSVKPMKKKSVWKPKVLRDLDSDIEAIEVDISTDDEVRGEDEDDSDEESGFCGDVGGDTVLMVGVEKKEVTVRGPPLRRRRWDENEDDDDEDDHIVEIKVNPVSSEDEESHLSEKKETSESRKIKKLVKKKSEEGSADVKVSIDTFESDVELEDSCPAKRGSIDFQVDIDTPTSSSSDEMDEDKSGARRRTAPTKEGEHPNQSLINIIESDKSEREKIIELVEQRISEHTKIIEGKTMGPQQLADHTKILQGSALVLKTLAEKTKKPVSNSSSVSPLTLPNPGKPSFLKKTVDPAKRGSFPKTFERVPPIPSQKQQPTLLSEEILLQEDPSVKELQKFSPLEKIREYDNLMKKYLSVLLDKNVVAKKLGEMKDSIKSYETKMMEKQKELDVAKKKIITLQGRIARTHTALSSFLSPNQIKLALQETKKVAWTPEEMLTAFTIKHLSKACYLFLRHKLNYPLPGISSLQRWMTTVSKGQPDAAVASGSAVVQEGASNVDDEDLSDHESLFNVDANDVIIEGTLEEINSRETEHGGGGRGLSGASFSRPAASSGAQHSVSSGTQQQQLRIQSQPRFVKIYNDQPSDKLSLVSRNLSEKVTIHKIPKNVEQNQTKVRPNLDNLARTNDKFPSEGNAEENNSFSNAYKEEDRPENSGEMIVDEGDELVGEEHLIQEDYGEIESAGLKMIKLEQNSSQFEEGQSYFTLSDINGLPDAQVISSTTPMSNSVNSQQKYFHQITIDGKIENRLVDPEEGHHIITSDNPQLLKAVLMDESGKCTLESVQHHEGGDSQQPKLILLHDPGTGEDIISFLDRDEAILNLVAGSGGSATAVGHDGAVLASDLTEAGYTVAFLENYVVPEATSESGAQPTISEKA